MKLHCPCCHAIHSVETLIEDEAARELLAMKPQLPPSLLLYLALFRPEKTSLAWSRALKLAQQVLALDTDSDRLEAALSETVAALRAKRASGENRKPLPNHNYLKRVLENVPAGAVVTRIAETRGEVATAAPSKTLAALAALETRRQA